MHAITTAQMAHEHFLKYWKDIHERECFYVFYLDQNYFIRGYDVLFMGTRYSCNVDNVLILRAVIKNNAKQFAIAHNHTNGNPEPSPEDLKQSRELAKMCAVMDIRVAQFIITDRSFYTLTFFDNI